MQASVFQQGQAKYVCISHCKEVIIQTKSNWVPTITTELIKIVPPKVAHQACTTKLLSSIPRMHVKRKGWD